MKKRLEKAFYWVCWKLVWIFYPKTTVEGAENLPEEPSIVVGNQSQANGPILAELYFPGKRAIWCAGQMMSAKEVPDYAYHDFWDEKPKALKPLFRLLFMRDRSHADASARLGDDVEPLRDLIQQAAGISRESARMFHLEMWIYVHGIAAMAATSFLDWDTELISASLTDAYRGLLARFKEKEAQE